VEVSIYLAEGFHGRGIGRRLYGTLLSVLRNQGYVTAYAGITLPHAASVGLHEALGFRPIGVYPRVGWKKGSWYDVGWWWLPLRIPDDEPVPPVPFREFRLLGDPLGDAWDGGPAVS
jgi:phosphinothricin acetyltransferase